MTHEGDLPGEVELRDFIRYVISTRAHIDMVEGAADFSVHVTGVMRASYERSGGDELAEFEAGSLSSMTSVAKSEIAEGFPLLHGHTLVGLWGALEACIEGICVAWLGSLPQTAQASYLTSLRVSLGEFLAHEGDDTWRWVLMQLDNSLGSSLKAGVGQFESVLDKIGLGGPVDKDLRDTLFFAKALRNLYAHQGGRADAKFLSQCESFDAIIGDRVAISRTQLTASYSAMVIFAETVFERVRRSLGNTPREIDLPPWIDSMAALRTMMLPGPSGDAP